MNPETSSSELSGEPMPAPIVVKQEPISTPETGPVSGIENIQVEVARQEEIRDAREQAIESYSNDKNAQMVMPEVLPNIQPNVEMALPNTPELQPNVEIVSPSLEVPVTEAVPKSETAGDIHGQAEEERKAAELGQESFARKAGELTGRVGRAAKRGAKAFGDTYRQAEEERKAAELGQESFARKAGRFTGRAGRTIAETWRNATAEAEKTVEDKKEKPKTAEAASESEANSVPQQMANDQIELNSAQKLIEKLRLEIEQLKKENEFSQLEGLGKELNDLLSKREKLYERVSGKSIGETMADAEKKVAKMFGYEKREDYVRALTEVARININAEKEKNLINKAFTELSEKERQKKYGNSPELYRVEMEKKREKMGLKSEEFYGLLSAGYKPQETKKKGFFYPIPSFRNFFRSERKVTIPPNGKKVWMRTTRFEALAKEAGENYTTNNTKEAQKRLGEQWGNAVGMQAEEDMKERAYNKDGAIEKIKNKCKEERIELVNKFLKDWEELSGNSKKLNSRESKAYEARGVEGEDINSLFKDAKNTEGNLNGNPENDSKVVSGLLKGYGVVVKSSKIAGKMLKGTGGLLKLLISLVTTATLGAVYGAGKGIEYVSDKALKIPKTEHSN
jgi:hypothetical protein